MSSSLRVVVALPPGFKMDESKHKNEKNKVAWEAAYEEAGEEVSKIFKYFTYRVVNHGGLHAQDMLNGEDEHDIFSWYACILTDLKYCLYYFEEGGCGNGADTITNVYYEAKELIDDLNFRGER